MEVHGNNFYGIVHDTYAVIGEPYSQTHKTVDT